MSKTFHVITEEEGYYEGNDKHVLYAFESLEEALYVLHKLEEEDTGHFYRYELSIVNDNHPYDKLSKEEMLSLRRERDAHKRAREEIEKQNEYVKLSQNRMMKIKQEIDMKKAQEEKIEKFFQERKAECQECKRKIDEFMEWLQNARNFIATYEEEEEDDENILRMSPKDYEYEANYKLSLLKNDIQQYLLDHEDKQVLELVNKPVCELLNLPSSTTNSQNMYFPKRLRQLWGKTSFPS